MRRLKNPDNVEKIEAVLFQVGKPLALVPFKAHYIFVHILCLQSRSLFSPVSGNGSFCPVCRGVVGGAFRHGAECFWEYGHLA